MTEGFAERLAVRAVRGWTVLYTAGLPPGVASSRRDEITCDLHEHRAWHRQLGRTGAQTAREMVLRAIRGAPADVSWRLDAGGDVALSGAAARSEPGTIDPVAFVLASLVVITWAAALHLSGFDATTAADWAAPTAVVAVGLAGLRETARRPLLAMGLIASSTITGALVLRAWPVALVALSVAAAGGCLRAVRSDRRMTWLARRPAPRRPEGVDD